MTDQETKKCAHAACSCMAMKDSKYCSTFCSGEGDTLDVTCGCGHPGCTPNG